MCPYTRCDDEVSLHLNPFFLPVQLNPLDVVLHIHNIAEKENINFYLKTETKPFTQNAYLLHFISSLHTRESKVMQN